MYSPGHKQPGDQNTDSDLDPWLEYSAESNNKVY